MKKILIIGGGFAGLSALNKLARAKEELEVTLIDARCEQNFLPMLPDVLGRGIAAEHLLFSLNELCRSLGAEFINEEVISVDLQTSAVKTRTRNLSYDYLILAPGSKTNFYGQEQIARFAYKLDSAQDARNILAALKKDAFEVFVVAGGGYTGIEVATNLRVYFDKIKKQKKIVIVELAPNLLGPLPDWIKAYVGANLKRLNIEIHLNTSIKNIEEDRVYLSSAETFDKSMLIWTAGVKTPDFIFNLNLEKSRQGRLKVDEYLRVNNNCFAVGDAAEFSYRQKPLRMAVQFSIVQAETAAKNILRQIRGLPLKKYRPVDLGYIIPMANNQSCGIILGMKVRGGLATFFHYLMCIYRSYSFKNRLGIIKDLIS